MRTAAWIAALAVVPIIAEADAVHRARYLMGTVCEVAAEHPEQIERAFAEAKRIESLISTWTESSELARVNRGEAAPGPELRALLDETLAWSEKTNGAFDPRIGHLVGRTKIAGAIEEGAFGKGYALDRMLALLDGNAMINFGGQIAVRGARAVSVANPADRGRPVLAFTIENASLSTSSGSHIFDPRTGKSLPMRGSASAIAKDALTADILSTALYVMGEDEGLRWANANHVAAIFITSANHIRFSDPAREQLRDVEILDRHFTLKD
jgi:FAD:protein FMN transferase